MYDTHRAAAHVRLGQSKNTYLVGIAVSNQNQMPEIVGFSISPSAGGTSHRPSVKPIEQILHGMDGNYRITQGR